MITQEIVKSLFDYREGFLYWKVEIFSKCRQMTFIGDRAGWSKNLKGKIYYLVNVNGKEYLLHRLIFLYHKGYLPRFIDHKDRNSQNCKIDNLRESTPLENSRNRTKHKNSFSKFKGVYKSFSTNKMMPFKSSLCVSGKNISLGNHINEYAAANAYNIGAVKYFGEFAVLNPYF